MKQLAKILLVVSIVVGTLISLKLALDLYEEKIKRTYISAN